VPPLAPLYDGPYRVLTRSREFFRIQMGDRTDMVSTSRLKPCMDPAIASAAPPRQGSPPGPQKDVTFHWPPVAPPLACLAVPPAPSALPAVPARTLVATGLSTPPVPEAGTVFPHGQIKSNHTDTLVLPVCQHSPPEFVCWKGKKDQSEIQCGLAALPR
jgi:hypothetical protein